MHLSSADITEYFVPKLKDEFHIGDGYIQFTGLVQKQGLSVRHTIS